MFIGSKDLTLVYNYLGFLVFPAEQYPETFDKGNITFYEEHQQNDRNVCPCMTENNFRKVIFGDIVRAANKWLLLSSTSFYI